LAEDPQQAVAIARILIVGPAWVGDMVMSQSLFKALRARHPDAAIDVLAPPATLPLLDFMPEVRRAIEMPFRHGELNLAGRRALGMALRREGYDIAIVVPRTLKAAAVAYWAGVPVRIGHPRGRAFGLLTVRREIDPKRVRHQAARFVALAAPGPDDGPLPAPDLRVPRARTESALEDNALEAPAGPLLILAPGSGNTPSKRWPADRFAAVARARHAAGWDVWLMGAPGDREVTAAVQEASGGICLDLGGRTSLGDAVALTALARQVVSNDTGTLHVAAALGRPTIAVFGPTDPDFTLPRSPRVRAVRLDLSCSPCFAPTCPLGHFNCMNELTPALVLDALDQLGDGAGAPGVTR
jgi:heptosyltransferase-2